MRCLDPHSPNLDDTTFYRWTAGNTLLFESRSNWGCPKTLSLKISTAEDATFTDEKGAPPIISEMGCGFVDLCSIWNGPDEESDVRTVITKSAEIHSFENAVEFDQHGEVDDSLASGEVSVCGMIFFDLIASLFLLKPSETVLMYYRRCWSSDSVSLVKLFLPRSSHRNASFFTNTETIYDKNCLRSSLLRNAAKYYRHLDWI